ncbi:hypothetical protein HELRODRAFT_182612 [Helobdella robusta]|uniref:Uncharacterized protein n=1 Tax=Helobdella robusta TaxID=6412 RepID=T1FIH2_HELRO|nr:hypothetical protein HELRODRAFT_182612 [Helobdella robusta]ESN90786.1 hypothetical protein HELRODRAFT_182612 [Helobdella robusta]
MLEKLYGSRTSNIYNISNSNSSKCSNVINKNISFDRKLCSDDQTLFQNTDNNHTVFDNCQCNAAYSMLGITLSYHNRKVFKDVNRLLFSAFPQQQPQHTPLVNAKEQYNNKKCRHVLHLLAALLNFASVDEMDDDSYFNNITNHNNYYDTKSSCVMSKNKSLKLDHICDTNTTEKNDYLKKKNSNNYHITKNSRNYFNDNGHSTSLTLAEVELNTSRYNYYTAGITSATSDTGTARDDDDDNNCYFNAFNGMTLEHENSHNNYDFYEYPQSKNTNENINRDKIGISDEDDKDSDCFVKKQFNFDDFSDMDGISNDNNVDKNFIVFENKQTPSATNVIDKGDDNFECLCDNIYDIEMLKLNNSNKFMMYLTEKWYVFLHLHHKLFKRLVDILKLSVNDYSQDDCKIDYDSNRNEKANDEQMRLRSRNFTKAATVTDTTALIDNTITTFATANIPSDTNQINGNMNFYNFALDICQQYIHNGTTCEDLIKAAMDSFNNRDNDQNIKLNKAFPLIVTLDKLIDVVVKEVRIQSLVLDELSCKSINLFKKCIIHSSSPFSSTFSLSSCLKRNDSFFDHQFEKA